MSKEEARTIQNYHLETSPGSLGVKFQPCRRFGSEVSDPIRRSDVRKTKRSGGQKFGSEVPALSQVVLEVSAEQISAA